MSESIIICAASVSDSALCEAYIADIFAEDLETICPRVQTPAPEQVRSWIATHTGESSVIFLAKQHGQIVGTINLTRFARPHIDHSVGLGLNVKLGERGKGIGRALLQKGLSWFKDTQVIERIELEVTSNNIPAIHLYEEFGFSREGVKRGAVKKGGQYFDLYVMGLRKKGSQETPPK